MLVFLKNGKELKLPNKIQPPSIVLFNETIFNVFQLIDQALIVQAKYIKIYTSDFVERSINAIPGKCAQKWNTVV